MHLLHLSDTHNLHRQQTNPSSLIFSLRCVALWHTNPFLLFFKTVCKFFDALLFSFEDIFIFAE
ncbi:hypothetical protein M2480_003197 [Parabacteroides sp. PFB2-12]|nr:hypothetical protein [Parabacteroides sp. PM6-13]MDH6392189.1 hypothetical protein [Parabacteroides sp. PFB2-12]